MDAIDIPPLKIQLVPFVGLAENFLAAYRLRPFARDEKGVNKFKIHLLP